MAPTPPVLPAAVPLPRRVLRAVLAALAASFAVIVALSAIPLSASTPSRSLAVDAATARMRRTLSARLLARPRAGRHFVFWAPTHTGRTDDTLTAWLQTLARQTGLSYAQASKYLLASRMEWADVIRTAFFPFYSSTSNANCSLSAGAIRILPASSHSDERALVAVVTTL